MTNTQFLIPINAISEEQIIKIYEYSKNSRWEFRIFKKCVFGFTFYEDEDYGEMNNFIMNLNLNKYIYWDANWDLDLDTLNRQILQEQRRNKIINIER